MNVSRTDRPNTTLAEAVDLAVTILIEDGPRAAATFLADCGAGFALICRVLAEPARRRAPDPNAMLHPTARPPTSASGAKPARR